MLSEGWDAKTVTHIMGLRAFTSQLLCEQVVGRGLCVSVPQFWALIGHLKWVRLQKSGKSRSICSAGWSSLVARRAHNAPNANRLCRIQTT